MNKRRFRTHTNPFNYDKQMPVLDLKQTFSHFNGIVDVEFGFGKGVFLRSWAKANPERILVGFEIRKLLVSYVDQKCKDAQLSNVCLVHGAAKNGLEGSLKGCKIEHVFIFHPDPWFKKKHHKRRLLNPEFLKLLVPFLMEEAKIYIMTDVSDLFDEIKMIFEAFPVFKKTLDWDLDFDSHWGAFSKKKNRLLQRACYTFCAQ